MLLTTERHPALSHVLGAANTLGLDVVRTSYGTYTYTRVQLGTIEIPAFDAPKWRDLGEGPSWQEKYTLEAPVTADIMWESHTSFPGYAVRVEFPVTSLLRQGGAKWGGVSLAANDDTTPKPSTHTLGTYDYDAFRQLAGGTFFGYAATLAAGVSFREVPYAHDPSKTHFVLDLGA